MAVTFVLDVALRELGEFERICARVAGLKEFGGVSVNVSTLAGKATYALPPGGSAWHEYASHNPTLFRLFPPPELEGFYPRLSVAENLGMLRAKARILRELGLGSAFYTVESHFLPEGFFEANPKLRGPRVDHPRRSRREEFAPCVAHPSVLLMYEEAMEALASELPALTNYYFRTNDTGGGICWTDWQYSGPNGPTACRDVGVLGHVKGLMEALTRGAKAGGAGDVKLHFTGNFSDAEWRTLRAGLPSNVRAGWDRCVVLGSLFEQCYPVRGVVDPLDVLMRMQGIAKPDTENVFLSFRTPYLYDRAAENFEAMDVVVELVEDLCRRPAHGPAAALERLQEYCDKWALGAGGDAGKLFDALYQLHGAMEYFRAAIPRVFYLAINGALSMRYVTRPLLAVPEALSTEEEAYFLKHVFNVSAEDARRDYLDVHGGSWTSYLPSEATDPRIAPLKEGLRRLEQVCVMLEGVGSARDGFAGRLAMGLRIYTSFMRSAGNFYAAGVLRRRSGALWNREPAVREKKASWGGDSDLLLLNEILRDEFENVEELMGLLEDGGLELVSRAERLEDEDTFLLGPDLIEQLTMKRRLMRRHWLDGQAVLPPPMK